MLIVIVIVTVTLTAAIIVTVTGISIAVVIAIQARTTQLTLHSATRFHHGHPLQRGPVATRCGDGCRD